MALTHLGMVAQARGEVTRSVELCEEALAIARAGSDDWTRRAALNNLGSALQWSGETDLLEEALELGRRIAEPRSVSLTAGKLADLALAGGTCQAADSLIAETLRSSREIDYRCQVGKALALDALLALHRGELEAAAVQITESIESSRADYDIDSSTQLLAAAATLAAVRSDSPRAAQLWAASDHERADSLHVFTKAVSAPAIGSETPIVVSSLTGLILRLVAASSTPPHVG